MSTNLLSTHRCSPDTDVLCGLNLPLQSFPVLDHAGTMPAWDVSSWDAFYCSFIEVIVNQLIIKKLFCAINKRLIILSLWCNTIDCQGIWKWLNQAFCRSGTTWTNQITWIENSPGLVIRRIQMLNEKGKQQRGATVSENHERLPTPPMNWWDNLFIIAQNWLDTHSHQHNCQSVCAAEQPAKK